MNREVLLIEPNYKNKYPPIGLMKLSTYFKMQGDHVTFFKGDLNDFCAEILCNELIEQLDNIDNTIQWKHYYPSLFSFIRKGKYSSLEETDVFQVDIILDCIKDFRSKYISKELFKVPRFDWVGITTLFTFYWQITIETINFAKQLCKNINNVMIGGIMSSILPDKVFEATGIKPFTGQLNHPGDIDDNDIIIDHLPLDYSILEEIDYKYPASDAYFSYMTRGCVNKCKFCAVPKLEPDYSDYIPIKENIQITDQKFGPKASLLLLDNNVLASNCFNTIIDEIKDCGFKKGDKFIKANEYEIAYMNLIDGYNDRGYIRKIIEIYQELVSKVKDVEQKQQLFEAIEKADCLHPYTATKESIISLDSIIRPAYEHALKQTSKGLTRYVDFNQGIDSRLITPENMGKLAEINIVPLRIAFDHWELKEVYEKSVRIAIDAGITHLSNYLLYNFEDKPEHLYQRLRLNVDLGEELNANIYSFPMKYHPISDENYFMNRDYIGKHWNRKFIRSVQAVLNSTKGKIGKGVDFFEEAFGKDLDEYMKILWMPETFIIYRRIFDANLRNRLGDKYQTTTSLDCDYANDWWNEFCRLDANKQEEAKAIIAANKFDDISKLTSDSDILNLLKYYTITRDDVECRS